MSFKIICMSDTHKFFPKIEETADFLIHSGDYSLLSKRNAKNLDILMEEFILFKDYLKRLKSKCKNIVHVSGNHDFFFENFPDIASQELGDAGIIYSSRGKRIGISIIVRRPFNSLQGQRVIKEISRLVYDYLG